ncbi:Fic family protein [Mucisphaera calidilacus]|uniref:Fic family protein n=1 Tax=Mucisphaera calidilacus TaxID=2527982 RepID=UPI001F429092|nr:Fic family protein [Mucisphaera calidilacus]
MRDTEDAYRHWDKVRILARAEGLDPEITWGEIVASRSPRLQPVQLHGHGNKPLQYLIPNRLQQELMLIDQQLAGQLTTRDEQPLSVRDKERFIVRALHEEAITSSMLEGAATTRREAKDMLRRQRKPRNRGEQMVLNNYQAIEFARDHLDHSLTPELLLELQTILTRDTLDRPDEVGRFRRRDDVIHVEDRRDNEIIHTPPDAVELPQRLERLCAFANAGNDTRRFIHPVIRASILHFQIGFDHPFCDGNGRTARTLFYWLMLRHGYWLFEYLPISRLIYRAPARYVRAYLYCETDDFDVTYFLMYTAEVIRKAREELQTYIEHKMKQSRDAQHIYRDDSRLNHRQREAIRLITTNPARVLTIAEHQERHQIVNATARTDLLKLAEWGYLTRERIGRRFEFLTGPRLIANPAP